MKLQCDEGFTIVEVLVAFVIMSVAVIAGMRVFADGVQRLASVEARTAAVSSARETLDQASADQSATGLLERDLTGEGVDWSKIEPKLFSIDADGRVLETIFLAPAVRGPPQ